MPSSTLSQWSWLDPALRPASGGDATITEREASRPKEPTSADNLTAWTFNTENIKLLPGVLHCEIVGGIDGAPRVAQIYTLPERLPCPWPPMGPFAPVRLEDLQMVEVPLPVFDAKEVSAPDEGLKAVKWRAFEPQTKSFGTKPLSTTTNIATVVPVPSQGAKQEQQKHVEEGDAGNERDDVVDVATLESAPSGKRNGGRKRSIKQVDGAEGVHEGRAKVIKRTYVYEGNSTYCTLCGDLLETDTDRRNHSSLCGTGRKHISCDLCGAPISRRDAVKRHQGYKICEEARAYYAQYGRYIRS